MFFNKLQVLYEQIERAAYRSGRCLSNISLIAVTKYATLDAIQEAYTDGLRNFGESRISHALPKISQLPKDIAWHFIGRLQSNKISKAIGSFALIHSVDSVALANRIAQLSCAKGCVTPILLQVNTSGEPSKQGFTLESCWEHFPHVLQMEGIAVQGLMTMAPLTEDTPLIRRSFSSLRTLRDKLQHYCSLPHLSMGMSHDFSIAIEEGATLIRIGSALFG